MIIQNFPLSFLSAMEHFQTKMAFSDDSRFIYLLRPNQVFLVYDSKFNEYLTMEADVTLMEYLKNIKGFRMNSNESFIFPINYDTLLILFNDGSFENYDNGYSALLLLVHLEFSSKIVSLIDKKIYKHCYYPYFLKDGSQFALFHIDGVDDSDLAECKCFLLEVDEHRISQTRNAPFIIEYHYLGARYMPSKMHFHDNKIWVFHNGNPQTFIPFGRPNPPIESMEQLSYFDLNESSPIKETPVELLKEDNQTYFVGGFLLYFQNQFEFEILNLHTKTWWKNGKNSPELQKFDINDLKLMFVSKQRTTADGRYNIDLQFNVTAIDKSTNRMLVVPLKNPQSLYDIAWTAVLNAQLFSINQSILPNNLRYQKLF